VFIISKGSKSIESLFYLTFHSLARDQRSQKLLLLVSWICGNMTNSVYLSLKMAEFMLGARILEGCLDWVQESPILRRLLPK